MECDIGCRVPTSREERSGPEEQLPGVAHDDVQSHGDHQQREDPNIHLPHDFLDFKWVYFNPLHAFVELIVVIETACRGYWCDLSSFLCFVRCHADL